MHNTPLVPAAPSPKVPEEMQLNVNKKQREMVLLEESLHTMRSRFNSRFLALRDIKREILATVAADNRRLREIDAELGGGGSGDETGNFRSFVRFFDWVELIEVNPVCRPRVRCFVDCHGVLWLFFLYLVVDSKVRYIPPRDRDHFTHPGLSREWPNFVSCWGLNYV